jgi:4-hydroxy-3-methylbut-2-en-1-yl diphosphate synthase IspG/GcpE
MGSIKSAIGIGILLEERIGATMRVSLTADPVEEIATCWAILRSLDLRRRGPEMISCPTCGRTQIDLIGLAKKVEAELKKIKTPIKVAVMGCVVNGPGESKHANIGISLPGSGENPVAPVYIDGAKAVTLKGDHIAAEFQALVAQYVRKNYAAGNQAAEQTVTTVS